MKTLYIEAFSGICGDMTLGAFMDLGVQEEILRQELAKLNLKGYELIISKKAKKGIMGTDVYVKVLHEEHHHQENTHQHPHEHHDHRDFAAIKAMIEQSGLSETVKKLSIKMFHIVAEAEGKVHGKPIEEVHFHEVGAIDSIVDLVGAAICFEALQIRQVVVAPLQVGTGMVHCQHGLIPIPAPATLEILKTYQIPFYYGTFEKELVTPTGAAIVAAVATSYGRIEDEILVQAIGYGTGKRDLEIPNIVRFTLGEVKKNKTERHHHHH